MAEVYLRQPGFAYSSCGPFTKNKKRIEKFEETGDSRYIYQNEQDKVCLQHDMVYRDFKGLTRKTAFGITKNPNYDGYQRGLASIVLRFFDKKNFWWCP